MNKLLVALCCSAFGSALALASRSLHEAALEDDYRSGAGCAVRCNGQVGRDDSGREGGGEESDSEEESGRPDSRGNGRS